jgi:hypothetical protein
MFEPELCGVEHETWGFDEGLLKVADVDSLADERVTRFRQVNADLMGPARFELALREGRSVQHLDDANVRDGETAELGVFRRPAKSVASVFDEPGRKCARRELPVY